TEVEVNTPFGPPSSKITIGELKDIKVAFLLRHGQGHFISPSEINSRANIFALKSLGVERVLSVSAVGSLKEEIKPLNIVLPDQTFDRTRNRKSTFFENGIVAHVNFADPFCSSLRKMVYDVCRALELDVVGDGTYVCIEGPHFSSRAESNTYRQLGFDIIGMTNLPEAKLAREAEICYCTIALVTDYDCWHEKYSEVDIEMIFEYLNKNAENAREVVRNSILKMPEERDCNCGKALEHAIITRQDLIPDEIKENLHPIIGGYMK
ncbi:S-methyl-5'-thioadenosine phosphorylase, partial [Thermodesulfobacteriota bacterium]